MQNWTKQIYATGVDYALTPMLVEAVQEQQSIIVNQNETINTLKSCILNSKDFAEMQICARK